ncbi:unnamed protein product [Nezara viridula]|uniref:Uncharacterized protein n=1 Tax=Nezara viridula TaxID=85310 RepID=A0A9P0ED94_NEZVI|nr:unnamed protein product [Nezara viridula]
MMIMIMYICIYFVPLLIKYKYTILEKIKNKLPSNIISNKIA